MTRKPQPGTARKASRGKSRKPPAGRSRKPSATKAKKAVSGRPEHEKTAEIALQVEVLIANGMSQDAVARAVDLSAPTLRKHYFREIELASATVLARLIFARYSLAMTGNNAALNKMIENIEAQVPRRKPEEAEPEGTNDEVDGKRGKKEQQELEANEEPTGKWGNILN